MNILVIGSGGREHALCRKFMKSPKVESVYCAPGNFGMKRDGVQCVDIAETNNSQLIDFAKNHGVSWTFVGPEIPLINGIVDDFEEVGLKIFGPNRAAALIEGSKSFAKNIMNRYNIPTAHAKMFKQIEEARKYIQEKGVPIVIKADGLAAGKGVVVAFTMDQAEDALEAMLIDHRFGTSGDLIVIEDYLEGEEFSLMSFVKNGKVYPMPVAQDHKKAYENDEGPNTGGMGAYSPVHHLPADKIQEALDTIVIPTVQAMEAEGCPFTGILYAGLILTDEGPKVIEFNARFGDPEAQVILERLDSDLAVIIDDLLNDKVPELKWNVKGVSLGVVLAAKGYPNDYEKGYSIVGLEKLSRDIVVIHAGVTLKNKLLVSSGGRVSLFMASDNTMELAQKKLYTEMEKLGKNHFFYRKDIGNKAR